jgi:hypothetical protein
MKNTLGVYSAPQSHWAGDAERRAIPWWLWWNILSIDAPAVAVAWAALLACAGGIRLQADEAAALVLSVWIIYTSDRLLDGGTAKDDAVLQERHIFCERNRFVLVALVIAASALVLWLMLDVALAAQAIAGVKLGVASGAVHGCNSRGRRTDCPCISQGNSGGASVCGGGNSADLVATHSISLARMSGVGIFLSPVLPKLLVHRVLGEPLPRRGLEAAAASVCPLGCPANQSLCGGFGSRCFGGGPGGNGQQAFSGCLVRSWLRSASDTSSELHKNPAFARRVARACGCCVAGPRARRDDDSRLRKS